MYTKNNHIKHTKWFSELPETIRYRFVAQWMQDEANKASNNKLAELVPGEKVHSESLIKSFRAFDLKKNAFKKVWWPDSGFDADDVHRVCSAINLYRKQNGREQEVSADAFYQRAWDELHAQYPIENPPIDAVKLTSQQTPQQTPVQPEQSPLATKTMDEKPVERKKRKIPATAGFAIMTLLMVLWLTLRFDNQEKALSLDAHQPYQHGLSDYLPGSVVQTQQLNKTNQLITLDKPVSHLAAKTCYPNLVAQTQHTTINTKTQLNTPVLTDLDTKVVLLPDLSDVEHLLKSQQVRFANVSKLEISKGLLNLGISSVCLASMQNAVDYGNKIDYYAIIKQAFVADSVVYEMVYHDNVNSTSISKVTTAIQNYFAGTTVVDSYSTTQHIKIKGPIVIAYISQEMSAQMSMQ